MDCKECGARREAQGSETPQTAAVRAFIKRIQAPLKVSLKAQKINGDAAVLAADAADLAAKVAFALKSSAVCLEIMEVALAELFNDSPNCQRILRLKLIVSETAELARALQERDEVETLDALADLLYVVRGAALTFDLPLDAAFWEVHTSNMTKGPRAAAHAPGTDKGKGAAYVAPNLQRVLDQHRRPTS